MEAGTVLGQSWSQMIYVVVATPHSMASGSLRHQAPCVESAKSRSFYAWARAFK